MDDLKQRLREVEGFSPPDVWSDIASREPRSRFVDPSPGRRVTVALLALVIAIAGFAFVVRAFHGGVAPAASPPPSESPSPSPPPHAGWVAHEDRASGLSIYTPGDWTFQSDPVPAMVQPTIPFAVASFDFPVGGSCAPDAALKSLPNDGVIMWAEEYDNPEHPSDFPARTSDMKLGPALGPFECIGGKARMVLFQDMGRLFQVEVVFGPDASDSTVTDAADVLNSLIVSAQPSPSPATTTQQATAHVVDTINVGRATSVTYGAGSVWVSVDPVNSSDRAIIRIDPQNDEIIATIRTPVVPSWEIGGGGLVVAGGSLWIAGSDTTGGATVRIDAATNKVVDTIRLPQGDPVGVAADSTATWVLLRGNPGQPGVVRIDPSSGGVVATIPLHGGYGRHIFVVDGSVLAAVAEPPGGPFDGGSLIRIDPSTNSVAGAFKLGTYPSVAEGGGEVWAVTDRGGLVQIDPGSGQPEGPGAKVPCTGDALAVGAGGVWCFDPAHDRALIRFDPESGEVDVRMATGDATGGTALAASPASIWVVNGNKLMRIDLG